MSKLASFFAFMIGLNIFTAAHAEVTLDKLFHVSKEKPGTLGASTNGFTIHAISDGATSLVANLNHAILVVYQSTGLTGPSSIGFSISGSYAIPIAVNTVVNFDGAGLYQAVNAAINATVWAGSPPSPGNIHSMGMAIFDDKGGTLQTVSASGFCIEWNLITCDDGTHTCTPGASISVDANSTGCALP